MKETNPKCEECNVPMRELGGLRRIWLEPSYLYQCPECKTVLFD